MSLRMWKTISFYKKQGRSFYILRDFNEWRQHRPIGITCAATLLDGGQPYLWFSRREDGGYADKMRREDAANLVKYLNDMTRQGYQIVTWNGLGFDFDVLAEESGCFNLCRDLALGHIDMMFHFFCMQGYPLGLNKAAKGLGLEGKTEGMTGDLAPVLWLQGQQEKVLEYVAQDVRTTLDVALSVDRYRIIKWMSNKGKIQAVNIPSGWWTVKQAKTLPVPDISWMTNPLPRARFYEWCQSGVPIDEKKFTNNENSSKPKSKQNQPVEQTKTKPPDQISDEQINDLFSDCDPKVNPKIESRHKIFATDYVESNDNFNRISQKSDWWGFACPCPICNGSPELDPIFIEFDRRDDPEDWRDDVDLYQ